MIVFLIGNTNSFSVIYDYLFFRFFLEYIVFILYLLFEFKRIYVVVNFLKGKLQFTS
jgi:hypothetical protein